eukprot:GHVH01012410.1.p1 GENE.GHVH01012410.1~~GHVH01012410.1.p1  ORF type:complete len:150 (+),score=11.89 GHVH01012410.1:50-451(+)
MSNVDRKFRSGKNSEVLISSPCVAKTRVESRLKKFAIPGANNGRMNEKFVSFGSDQIEQRRKKFGVVSKDSRLQKRREKFSVKSTAEVQGFIDPKTSQSKGTAPIADSRSKPALIDAGIPKDVLERRKAKFGL